MVVFKSCVMGAISITEIIWLDRGVIDVPGTAGQSVLPLAQLSVVLTGKHFL